MYARWVKLIEKCVGGKYLLTKLIVNFKNITELNLTDEKK